MITKEKQQELTKKPKFRDPSEMTTEELSDPDYRLKQLTKGNGAHPTICSKCHHCR